MKADLAAKLQSTMRGGITPKSGVAGVTGVAGVSATSANSLKLQQLRPLRVKTDKVANDAIRGVACGVASPSEPDEAELEECKGIAMGSVPEPYLDAWARLQCQRPMRVSDEQWRQAIDDAGRFLDQWGGHAVEFCWTPADLFDAPAYGKSGLVWFLRGETVESLGLGHAGLGPGKRVFDRINHTDWINPKTRRMNAARISEALTSNCASSSLIRAEQR